MKKILSVLVIALGIVTLSSCGASKDTMTIGFAASTFTNPFFNDIQNGILSVLNDSDYKLISMGADNDAAKQANQVEDMIARKVDLILLNPVDSTTVGTIINEANQAGIPVITVDRSAATGTVVAHVASDNVAGGEMAATYLKSICPTGTPTLELIGQAGASAATDRQNGFESVFGVSNIAQAITANWDRTQAQTVTEAFLAAQGNPASVCVFGANDEMALGAVQAIKANPTTSITNSFVVGFDAIDDAINSIKAGEMSGTIAQQPVEIGKLAAKTALDVLAKKTVSASIPVDLSLVTEESLNSSN